MAAAASTRGVIGRTHNRPDSGAAPILPAFVGTLAPSCSSDFVDVREIARASRCQFGLNEVLSGYEVRRLAGFRTNNCFNAPFPCGIKIDPRNRRRNIETVWLPPKTKKAFAVLKVLRANASERGAELGERPTDRLRVLGIRFDEKVHVLCEARLRVIDHCEAPDDKVPNAMGLEGGQKVFAILVRQARSSIASAHKRP